MVRPRPAPRSTTARTLYGRPRPRSADAKSPCATAVRISDDEMACPSSFPPARTRPPPRAGPGPRSIAAPPPPPPPRPPAPPRPARPGARGGPRRTPRRSRRSPPPPPSLLPHHDAGLEHLAHALRHCDELSAPEQRDVSRFPCPVAHRHGTSVDHRGTPSVVQLPSRQVADELRGIAQRVRRHAVGRHGSP